MSNLEDDDPLTHAASVAPSKFIARSAPVRKAEKQLEAALLEGLKSPESELTPADWKAIRKEALARVQARKKPR